jgi:hydroxymethylpyrimidine pyrophosphatase-like HAD family hydrolase
MYFTALAVDFDGTLAHDGKVEEDTYRALARFKESGRRLLLVTGRELDHLKDAFPGYELVDRIVAENGAVVYDPVRKQERLIGAASPRGFVAALRQRGVEPLSIGKCIVGTWQPNETVVLEVIRDLGLELQIIFNKGAVMVLPPGINKAAGLKAALEDLELSPHNVVAVGDAENDLAFLNICGCSAAVANALPSLKQSVDLVLEKERGAGVIELIDRIHASDAKRVSAHRRAIRVGTDRLNRNACLNPDGGCVLISGSSGIGKSTLATALAERMAERGFQFCIFDPEGDYAELEQAIPAGTAKSPPNREEALKLLRKLDANVVVNTQALEVDEHPSFFAALFPHISNLRVQTGRPHWLLIDEAHHLLPAKWERLAQFLPEELDAAILITVHPEALAAEVLKRVRIVVALGDSAGDVVARFCEAIGSAVPEDLPALAEDEVLIFTVDGDVRPVKPDPPSQSHKRHTRKYAEGELGADRSFYFRGPDGALNLRAQNLIVFLQVAAGVDDRTWEFHRTAGDYSSWFRNAIKDNDLADEAAKVEQDRGLDAQESRKRIIDAVARRYTASAKHNLE